MMERRALFSEWMLLACVGSCNDPTLGAVSGSHVEA